MAWYSVNNYSMEYSYGTILNCMYCYEKNYSDSCHEAFKDYKNTTAFQYLYVKLFTFVFQYLHYNFTRNPCCYVLLCTTLKVNIQDETM